MPIDNLLLSGYLLLIFLINVFPVDNAPNLNIYFTAGGAFLLILYLQIVKKTIKFPKVTIILIIFLILTGLSMIFAIDKETSYGYLLVYLACFSIFLYVYNLRDKIEKSLNLIIMSLCLVASVLYLLNIGYHSNWFASGQSLFYGGYFHNEIGNLLVLGIVAGMQNGLNYLYLLFFPIYLFAYSRSAYLALFIVSLFHLPKKKYASICILACTLLFFLFTAKETRTYFPKIQNLAKRLEIPKDKSFLADRPLLFSYAVSSIKDTPWLGVGPGNFKFFVSRKQVDWGENTTTAHDIFLDVAAENGLPAAVFLVIFVLTTLIYGKKSLPFYLYIALTVIFSIDFAYRYSFFIVLWFILAALSLEQKEAQTLNLSLFVVGFFILIEALLLADVFNYLGMYRQALLVFPLNKTANEQLISQEIAHGERKNALGDLSRYSRLYGNSYVSDYKIGWYYYKLGDIDNAIKFYEKSVYGHGLYGYPNIQEILFLYVGKFGMDKGGDKFEEFIDSYIKNLPVPKKSDLMTIINSYCKDYLLTCK